MFGQQRLLIITFIILAFCQLCVHGRVDKPSLNTTEEAVLNQTLSKLNAYEKAALVITLFKELPGDLQYAVLHDSGLEGSVLKNDNRTGISTTPAPGPTDATGSATTQYAFVPMMLLPVLPIYYML